MAEPNEISIPDLMEEVMHKLQAGWSMRLAARDGGASVSVEGNTSNMIAYAIEKHLLMLRER